MSNIHDAVDAVRYAAKTLAQSNAGDETITLRIRDMRDILHRYLDPTTGWLKFGTIAKLESELATALIEARQK